MKFATIFLFLIFPVTLNAQAGTSIQLEIFYQDKKISLNTRNLYFYQKGAKLNYIVEENRVVISNLDTTELLCIVLNNKGKLFMTFFEYKYYKNNQALLFKIYKKYKMLTPSSYPENTILQYYILVESSNRSYGTVPITRFRNRSLRH